MSFYEAAKTFLIQLDNLNSIPFKKYGIKPYYRTNVARFESKVERLLYHPTSDIFWLTKEQVLSGKVEEILDDLDNYEELAICSNIKFADKEQELQIPVLDFSCKVSDSRQRKTSKLLKANGQMGLLINSGKSYQFLGFNLLTCEGWVQFNGKSLLYTGYAEVRYIGHKLIDGFSDLRISHRSEVFSEPKVIEVV